jgi:hypothetical protein
MLGGGSASLTLIAGPRELATLFFFFERIYNDVKREISFIHYLELNSLYFEAENKRIHF